MLMRKFCACLGYLIQKQTETLIKLLVKHFNAILQDFLSLCSVAL